MKFRLGYVAISLTLDEIDHFHTMTYSSYQKNNNQINITKLDDIINKNLDLLKLILEYNLINQIYFYRISHHIIPLATHTKVRYDYINRFKDKYLEIGKIIKKNNIRLDSHPDQFCVLNSTKEEVVQNSKRILNFNYKLFKALNIKSKVVLHIGGSEISKQDGIKRFKTNFLTLPPYIKKMIILENDDKIYNIVDTLELCEDLKIPMVLDYHHYLCNHEKEKLIDYLPKIYNTWQNTGLNPKVHFSSPKSKKEKRTHSTYISLKGFLNFLNEIKQIPQDIDIMLECKGKDEALLRLSRQLIMTPGIKYINNSTFEID